jgi:homoserine kinase
LEITMRLRIRVPASSANLGSGFDCIGIALDWWNTIQVETIARGLEIECPHGLPRNKDNAVVQGMQAIYERAKQKMPPVRLQMDASIPIASGLGSSSAALVGGMLAANALMGNPFSRDNLVTFATHSEGHPDNVAPALLGGLIVAVQEGEFVQVARIPVPHHLRTVVFIPTQALLTKVSRGVLPNRIPRADAVYNAGRTALWIAALYEKRWDWLDQATRDRLHQPYRASLVRGMEELFDAARSAGALGVALSGAGPTIIAFTKGNSSKVAREMERTAKRIGVEGVAKAVAPAAHGAQVERIG